MAYALQIVRLLRGALASCRIIGGTNAVRRPWLFVAALALPGLLLGCPDERFADSERTDRLVQADMAEQIAFLDSPVYARSVSWEEHVVLSYRLAQGRDPSDVQFALLRGLRDEEGLKRSDVLSFALRGEERGPTWEQCRAFLDRAGQSDFRADAAVRAAAHKLTYASMRDLSKSLAEEPLEPEAAEGAVIEDTGVEEKAASTAYRTHTPYTSYSTYFGYLHAHSRLSDGRGTPLEAYTHARDVAGLDFFALTDHGEFMALWPWLDPWQRLKDAAEATNAPGSFAALWGFEWSSPVFGHLNVMNTEEFAHCLQPIRLRRMYRWIAARPEAFARFNHPGDYDFFHLEFLHFFPCLRAAPQIVGVELFNKDRSFDSYYYAGSWFSPLSYWDVGNLSGWYLGALGGQDNHQKDWGSRNESRTAVLTEALTREAVTDAYLSRRFYATEDKDLHLDFRCQGYPMGARLEGVTREFEVTAWDAGGDAFQEIRLFRNGALIQAEPVAGSSIVLTLLDLAETGSAYYYVIVSQTDDNDGNGRCDEAISSPIWIVD